MAPPMKPSREEMLAVTMNQKLAKQGAKTRKLAEARDVNTMPDPKTYAAVMGMLGTPPNEMGFSVAHPQYKEIMAVAEPAFYAGTAAQLAPFAKPAAAGVKATGRAVGQALNDRLLAGQSLTPGFNTPAPINFVIKNERGNWLAGNPEKAVAAYKSGTIAGETPAQRIPRHEELLRDQSLSAESRASVERLLAQERQRDALDKWVDSNLLNYVKKEMGSPSDTIRLTLDKRRDEIEAKLAKELDRARKVAARANAEADPRKKANLMRQSQQIADDAYFEEELAASNMFPIRESLRGYAPDVGTVNQRVLAGFPEQGMARNPEASAWESLADESIFPTKVKDYLETKEGYEKYLEAKDKYEAAMQEARNRMTEKWIDSGLSPKQAAAATSKMDIFDLDSSLGDTNLRDLTNEMNKYVSSINLIRAEQLKNNPWIEKLNREEPIYKTSAGSLLNMNFDHVIDVLREDLTAGRISPEQLNKVSIDQAIRRTQEYDIENARKMIQAKIAAREGMPVYKEYPEGFKWYELNKPGDFAAESQAMGHSVRGYEPPYGHADWVEGSGEMGSLGYGHGGWEGIKSGRAKVYSLVDPKGQSHVTVELGKPYLNRGFRGEPNVPTGEEHTRLLEEYVQGQREGTIPSNITAAEYWRQKQGIAEPDLPFEITQIKGKQNEAPNQEYLPFVQDFVTSSGMNVTRDLQNTGLIPIDPASDLAKTLKTKGLPVPKYVAPNELTDLLKQAEVGSYTNPIKGETFINPNHPDWLDPPPEGMKDGGEVKATPVKNKEAHAVAKALDAFHGFVSKPFGYNNPPGEIISELLGIPATARTLERIGYGEPLTTGRGMTAKPRDDTMEALMSVAPLASATKGLPVGAVIKPKGGNWLTGVVQKQVGKMKMSDKMTPEWYADRERWLKEAEAQGNERQVRAIKQDVDVGKRNDAINDWIDRNLTNYIKKEMATPEDPVRKLAEQGITHKFDLGDYRTSAGTTLLRKRGEAGFPLEGMGQSDLAKKWENLADYAVRSNTAKQYTDPNAMENILPMYRQLQVETNLRDYPWLSKVDPETNIYQFARDDVGFDHIVDVLRQDVREGRIRPEQLSKVSMEQAVRRTYEYDQEMAKKMREAAIKQTEGMPVHKEYPEGYRWVELALPEAKLGEGYRLVKDEPSVSNWKVVPHPDGNGYALRADNGQYALGNSSYAERKWNTPDQAKAEIPNYAEIQEVDPDEAYKVFDPSGNVIAKAKTEKGALNQLDAEERTKVLENALKYEGETMGHCVGGYCPDVLEGRSRIYSLRDAKGEPHVTVEVQPSATLTPEKRAAQIESLMHRMRGEGMSEEAAMRQVEKLYPESETFSRIVQIKGKQNRAPNEQYLPYVQDFVKGGQWSDVGDLRNTGLVEASSKLNHLAIQRMKERGMQVPKYATEDELNRLFDDYLNTKPPEEGMKDGGEVKATPVKNKQALGMSKALQAVHGFASKPFGYNNPPGEMISEFLGIPATARTLERMGYGEPLTTGKGMTTKPREDTMEALMSVAPLAPATKNLPVGAVIKNERGNWLAGNPEKAVAVLKSGTIAGETPAQRIPRHEELLKDPLLSAESRASVERHLAQERRRDALDKWVDSNLLNYVKKDMGSPSDTIRLTLDKRRDEIEAKFAKEQQRAQKIVDKANAEVDPRKKANLMRQSQQMLAEASFEKDLATSNMFPIRPELQDYAADVGTVNQRVLYGFPEQGMARNPEASAWENFADESIFPTKVKDYLETKEGYGKYVEAKDSFEKALHDARERMTQKWIDAGLSQKQAAAATSKMDIFDLDSSLGDTNLVRLTNEMNKYASTTNLIRAEQLKNNPWIEKLNPEEPIYKTSAGSVLNMNLDHVIDVLREDLTVGRISPEQLNKVSIDQAIRRTQEYDIENARKMIQAKNAAREGMPVYKEYPEGFKWYELNRPGDFAAESQSMGHSVRGYEPPYGHEDWVEGSGEMGSLGYGHGGWEGIKSGRAKVYSLVDPKGQSHVTVEVGKPYLNRGFRGEPNAPTGDEHTRLLEEYVQGQREGTIPSNITAAEYWRQKQGIAEPELPFEITQIKGKQNAAPNEEYLPFVQDFVTSSGMSVTRDLQNTGLRDISKTPKIQEYLKKKGIDTPRYIPEKQYLEYEDDYLMDQLYPPGQGMKRGGEVKMGKGGNPSKKKAIDDFWAGMKEAVPPANDLGPLDTLKQNLSAAYEGAKKIPGNLYNLATDPAGYVKNLPAPTGQQIMDAFGPGNVGAGFMGSYRPHTPLKPDPEVGTRYKVQDMGGLAPRKELDIEKIQGSQAKIFPWDATHRNKLVTEVSEVPLTKPVLTEGGDEYMLDVNHIKNRIAGASNEGIANRIQDRINQASWENLNLGGTGKVYGFPSRMGEGAEFFSTFPADIAMDLLKQGALNKKELAALTKDIRTMKFEGKDAPFAGAAPVGTPEFEAQLRTGIPKSQGKKGQEIPGATAGNLRKGLMDRLGMVGYQKRLGYNLPDLQGAVLAENLKGVPKGYVGNVAAELDPGAALRPSKSSSYSTDFSGQYAGSMANMPVEFLMPNTYELIYRQMREKYPKDKYPKLTPESFRNMTIGAMEKRKENISEMIGQRSIDAVKTYQEGLKKGEFNPNNIQEVYDYMRRKKLELKLKSGGAVQTKSGLLKVKRKK